MDQIKCSSVEISEQEISEFDKNTKTVGIQRKDISEISLKYGFIGERFFVQIICGIILIALGLLLGLLPIFHMLKTGDFP